MYKRPFPPIRTATTMLALFALCASALVAQSDDVPRRHDGRPDLSGTYDRATLTPLTRPRAYGDKLYMSEEEAKALADEEAALLAISNAQSAADREAPAAGGAAPAGAPDSERESLGAGNVGGYNAFWIDRGSEANVVDGKFRTSIIHDPENGQQPRMTPKGFRKIADNFSSFTTPNDGTAWWLDGNAPGPFDGPEDLALAERCLLGFSAGPPLLPGLYNNYTRIVQTDTHVMIMAEMVHDVRVIRLDAEHDPEDVRKWLGDAVGHFDGDTLVVETKNFRDVSGTYGADENLHLTERFSLVDGGNMRYNFTVTDPTIWTAPWSGEYVWAASDKKAYEYACHEGNYAMDNILKGARLLENERRKANAASTDDD